MTRAGTESLIRQTTAGAVRGMRERKRDPRDREATGHADPGRTVLSWKGIPFAAAPVAPLRFRRPQPPEPWEGTRLATRFGPMAPQRVLKSMEVVPGVAISEDCLTVNVWAPAGALPGSKPVMVWIHGGGYFQGSTAQRFYDGRNLASEGDVVVVSLNYRLGVIGFVDFTTVAESPAFDSNLGLRDQIAALEWVRENVAAFGGDPGNVTLFGESAGGACVIALMASPLADGLFHRAIAQSAPVTSVYGRDRAAAVARRFLDIVGIEPADAHRLQELDPFALVDAGGELVHEVSGQVPGTLALAPVHGDDVLPEYPLTVFREGRAPRIPLIIGTNRDESSFFKLMRSPLLPITPEAVKQMFLEIASDRPEFEDAAERITAAYPAYPRRSTPAEVSRDAGFRMPSIWLAEAHSRHAPTWMYRFDHATPLLRITGIGATHAAELAYVFGSFAPWGKDLVFRLGGRAEALRVSERMQAHWLAFARTGVPDDRSALEAVGMGEAPWPPYDEATRSTLIIDREDVIEHDPDGAVREAWGPEIVAFR
ncbi:carboxylesterase/lipase family protein [Herbiconiux sp. CPCC 203407]|uniref:Carboxylic ester hydrolase n=1 Tax=Herbiconiux oxytropis TaxID=2970915 RepID=A0AA42BU07_9MICO|nr:carboxylesterase/lipase family protein [Herbiconiux oxytropis]MCS5722755.1 carboxylesterase/lipase family protein [Herbiconiux oxytropis]MCS5727025.1 carboxylesterase/lipase family protein [Herbiconiux oxytropis]